MSSVCDACAAAGGKPPPAHRAMTAPPLQRLEVEQLPGCLVKLLGCQGPGGRGEARSLARCQPEGLPPLGWQRPAGWGIQGRASECRLAQCAEPRRWAVWGRRGAPGGPEQEGPECSGADAAKRSRGAPRTIPKADAAGQGAQPRVLKAVAPRRSSSARAAVGGGDMCAVYVTNGAAYMFHSAARMPKEPRRAAIAPARAVSLERPGAHEKVCTVAKAAGCHLPLGGSGATSSGQRYFRLRRCLPSWRSSILLCRRPAQPPS